MLSVKKIINDWK